MFFLQLKEGVMSMFVSTSSNSIPHPQMEVAEKLSQSRNYETLNKVAEYAQNNFLFGTLAFGLPLVACGLGSMGVLGNKENTVVKFLNTHGGSILENYGKPLLQGCLASVVGGLVAETSIMYFQERAKDLKKDAQRLLDIIDKKPIVIEKFKV